MTSSQATYNEGLLAVFNLEVQYSRGEVREDPPEVPASEYMIALDDAGEADTIAKIECAAAEVSSLIGLSRTSHDGEQQGILDIFSASQIFQMQERLNSYLGQSVQEHLGHPEAPKGYPVYIGKLATYFAYTDDDVTSQFGSFIDRHIDPSSPNATGPLEKNSRQYAVWATDELLKQLRNFYQFDAEIELRGPVKPLPGTLGCWERGVAESHFIILDYIRDQVSFTSRTPVKQGEQLTMGIDDLEQNLKNLTVNRSRLVKEIQQINPVIARQIGDAIDHLSEHTVDVFHRGRMGVPRFHKHPENARRALQRVEALLDNAVIISRTIEQQEDIPVLEIE